MAKKETTAARAPVRASSVDGQKISDDMKKNRETEAKAAEKVLADGHYFEVSLPHQPCVKIEVPKKDEEGKAIVKTERESFAVAMYNRWASILNTVHKYTVTKVPCEGLRLHYVKNEETKKLEILLN